MNNLLDVPLTAITALTSEQAVAVTRAILRSECRYARLSPSVLTISSRLTTQDGGIDVEVNVSPDIAVPSDCIFPSGVTGFQIKSGTAFKPWMQSAIRSELLNNKDALNSEVERLVKRGGHYTLLCTGHDLTPEQRNDARQEIANALTEVGFPGCAEKIEVLGASQIAEFAERYPGVASLLAIDPIQEAWLLEEWQRDAHISNAFAASPEQEEIIARIREGIQGEIKHFRVLGEPGLGKTRIVLEAVKDENIAPYVLYIPHGLQFGQTKLFRQLLRTGYEKPLVLVIDELPETELTDIWRHLKPRCGSLKIVSLDHGRDETHDEEIERLNAPRLPDDVIKQIIARRIGESRDLDRWVVICEGSPRVAQAVADNLAANPGDILKSPATVPLWSRFLHGYGSRDESTARQIDCVAQHLALFSRFGYEAPVENEAKYIAELIRRVDPTIGWARFQEIVQDLRARRALQGSRTLFFVPKALHIYLWKQFWENYGRGFSFTQTFQDMPESLHAWFMNLFKYAGDKATASVIEDILRPEGVFSQREVLTSDKGSQFLSILAEANPAAVLRLLEITIGKWLDQELFDFDHNRQQLVWTLEKIAVWSPYTVRSIQLLARLAVNENSHYSNNATGTLTGLFRIGPEAATTESTPEARLPAVQKLLRSSDDKERRLGLKSMDEALDSHGMGWRMVGPEYQGLRERAKLWIPATYGDWWQAKFIYFQALVDETRNWPSSLRAEVCEALLEAARHQITTPPCTELAFQVLNTLVTDIAMRPDKLNHFFWHWQKYQDNGKYPEIAKRLRSIERRYTRRDLASRFQRYVIDVDWQEWDEDFRERHDKPKNRCKMLVNALARRIARNPEKLDQVRHLLAPSNGAPALWDFGEKLAQNDSRRNLLLPLIEVTLETKHHGCLHGYLSAVRVADPALYLSIVQGLLGAEKSAWLGASIVLHSDYDDELFRQCLDALKQRWIDARLFSVLRFGKALDSVPPERKGCLLRQLSEHEGSDAPFLLIELLDYIPFNELSPFDSDFVFGAVTKVAVGKDGGDGMSGYHWKNVCLKLVKWDKRRVLPLLDGLLTRMGEDYRLSYHSDVASLAYELVQIDPIGAWECVKQHLEATLPQWRDDLLNWLKGGLGGFDERSPQGAVADLPVTEILEWIEVDPEVRAPLIAHAAAGSLDDERGGRLTRALLHRYGQIEGVQSGISCTFHSGGWSGSTSVYLKRKRDKFRLWLAADFEFEVMQWVETEIEYLDRYIEREEINEERSRFD